MKYRYTISFIFFCLVRLSAQPSYTIKTIAGTGLGDGNIGINAVLAQPNGVAVDSTGNIYIADTNSDRLRKVSVVTGLITTIAGSGSFDYSGDGGSAVYAKLNGVFDLDVDQAGNVYFADANNNRIRKVDIHGTISTVAGTGASGSTGDGGSALNALLNYPFGIALDLSGNIYFTDSNNGRVRKINASTGFITTIAGTGVNSFSGDGTAATLATLNHPTGIAVDHLGNVYVGDQSNNRVRKINATTGIITTLAGNGNSGYSGDGAAATAAAVILNSVAVDWSGNVYVADWSTGRIRKIAAGTGIITTVAGNGVSTFGGDKAAATSASLSNPSGVAVTAKGNIYIADRNNNRIRLVTKSTGVITTVAGNGTAGYSGDTGYASLAELYFPFRTILDVAGNLFVADNGNNRIRKISPSGKITTVAGTGTYGFSGDGGLATAAQLAAPWDVAVDAAGNLYIADTNNSRIRVINATTGIISTVAGTGSGGYNGDGGLATAAQLSAPRSVTVDVAGNLYIVDAGNWRIRKVTKTTGIISTVAGTGVQGYSADNIPATTANIQAYYGRVKVDATGNIYLADTWNARIRKINLNGTITTVAGNGNWDFTGDAGPATNAALYFPYDFSLDKFGNLFIADTYNNRIRYVSASSGIISTIAGTGNPGNSGDGANSLTAQLAFPSGVTVGANGAVYIADAGSQVIREMDPTNPGYLTNNAPVTRSFLYNSAYCGKSTVFAVGDTTTLFRSINNGNSWSLVPSPSPAGSSLADITFADSLHGYVVGSKGLILSTTNGGAQWTLATALTTKDLWAVQFPTNSIGYAVGNTGAVLKTTNGGSSWTVTTGFSPRTDSLYGLYFTSALTGFVGGTEGFYKTSDGGQSWQTVGSDIIFWVTFPSAQTGYAVGPYGVILKTKDGGNNWVPQNSGTSYTLWGAYFVSPTVGFAVGDYGTILKTNDGGATWISANVQSDISSETLNGITFSPDGKDGIAVGGDGTIVLKQLLAPPTTIAWTFPDRINGNKQAGPSATFTVATEDVERIDSISFAKIGIRQAAAKQSNLSYTALVNPTSSNGSSVFSALVQDDGSDPLGYHVGFYYSFDDGDYYGVDSTTLQLYYGKGNNLSLTGNPLLITGSSSADGYRLISIPLALDSAQALDLFRSDVTQMAYDKSKWRLLSYDAADKFQDVTSNVAPADGYWFLSRNTINLNNKLIGSTVPASAGKLNLKSGWNIVGNPYPFPVSWDAGTDVLGLWTFTGTSFNASNSLDPGVGYFVWANTAGSYAIPLDPGTPFNSRQRSNTKQDPANNSWELSLNLLSDGLTNAVGGLGMHPDALSTMDRYDVPAMPIPDELNLAAIFFLNPRVNMPLNKDVRTSGSQAIWNFQLLQPQASRITVSWSQDIVQQLPYELYLVDVTGLEVYNMKESNNLVLRPGSTLKVVYGDPEFIKQNTLPDSNVIGEMFPNPAAGRFFVPVAVSDPGRVSVKVYNQNGAIVYEGNSDVDSGYTQIVISELNTGAGLYLVSIQIAGPKEVHAVQKLIFK